jgi:hypothetical protein
VGGRRLRGGWSFEGAQSHKGVDTTPLRSRPWVEDTNPQAWSPT